MHDVGGKILSGVKSMYIDSLTCFRLKRGESEWFRIDSSVRQECITSPWVFTIHMDAMMKEVKMELGMRGVNLLEEEREWRLP